MTRGASLLSGTAVGLTMKLMTGNGVFSMTLQSTGVLPNEGGKAGYAIAVGRNAKKRATSPHLELCAAAYKEEKQRPTTG
jgi:hypothetical protein